MALGPVTRLEWNQSLCDECGVIEEDRFLTKGLCDPCYFAAHPNGTDEDDDDTESS